MIDKLNFTALFILIAVAAGIPSFLLGILLGWFIWG